MVRTTTLPLLLVTLLALGALSTAEEDESSTELWLARLAAFKTISCTRFVTLARLVSQSALHLHSQ